MLLKFLGSIFAILTKTIEGVSFIKIQSNLRDAHKELAEWMVDWQVCILFCFMPEQLVRWGKQAVALLIAVLVVLSSLAQAQLNGQDLLLAVGWLAVLAMGAAAVLVLKNPLMDRPQPSWVAGLL